MATFLESVSCKDFPRPSKNDGKVIVVDADDKAKDAMLLLMKHNILSAPVWDGARKEYLGMLDMVDIVSFATKNFQKADFALGEGFAAVMEQAENFAKAKVRDIADFSQRNPFVPVPDDVSLRKVVECMAENNIRRVGVFDAEGNLVNVITQSAVIDVLRKHAKDLGALGERTVADLKIGTSPVITVDMSNMVEDAFKIMMSRNVAAVAVVNRLVGGQIVATVSVKDIRSVVKSPADMHRLYDPISSFLRAIHDSEINACNPTVVCRTNTSLNHAIEKLAASKLHRLWVVDAENRPAKVVSLRDVLQALIS